MPTVHNITMNMANAVFDSIVVGAGIEGSATAYSLVKAGQRTLLLEQFPLPHSRGSSHGQSRIIRKAYHEDFYVRMMLGAYPIWKEIEKASGISFFKSCPLLVVGDDKNDFLKSVSRVLEKNNIQQETLSHKRLEERFPMVRYSDDFTGVVDGSAGILSADRALAAFWQQFKALGGELRDGEQVTSIHPGTVVTIRTNEGIYKTRSLIITAGPWTTKLLAPLGLNLPLKAIKIPVFYWKDKHNSVEFPVLIHHSNDSANNIYALPAAEYPGLTKVCLHCGPEIDPDARDDVDDTWVKESVRRYVRSHFPTLETHPSIVESCIYTMTPDERYILDRHPGWSNIIIGAGFSGHGFKMAPIVGQVLSELAMNKKTSYDLKPFAINRFLPKSSL